MENKNAISLIVLVITIIVMSILAATIIITLSNTNIISEANGYTADKNCAIFLPTVVYDLNRSKNYDTVFESNRRFPASFHYLTCVANASERYAE